MALFKKLYNHENKPEVDKLILFGRSSSQIYDWLRKKGVENISKKVVEDYVNNWSLVVLLDSHKDYLFLVDKLEGWTVFNFSEHDIATELKERNSFRRELILARTEYRLRELYKNLTVDEKTYKDLTSIIITTMAHQEKINEKGNSKPNGDLTPESDPSKLTDIDVSGSASGVDVTDLEKYLYSKTPQEQQIIRQFLNDMQKVLKVVDLDDYVPKEQLKK